MKYANRCETVSTAQDYQLGGDEGDVKSLDSRGESGELHMGPDYCTDHCAPRTEQNRTL